MIADIQGISYKIFSAERLRRLYSLIFFVVVFLSFHGYSVASPLLQSELQREIDRIDELKERSPISANKAMTRLLRDLREDTDPQDYRNAFYLMTTLAINAGDYRNAENYIGKLNYLANKNNDQIAQVQFYLAQASLAQLSKTSDEALEYIEKAQSLISYLKNSRLKQKANFIESYIYENKGDVDRALKLRMSVNQPWEDGNSLAEIEYAWGLQRLGFLHYDLNDFDMAIKYNDQAMIIAKRLNLKVLIASLVMGEGIYQRDSGKITDPSPFYKMGLRIGLDTSDIKSQIYALNNLADNEYEHERYDSCARLSKKELKLSEKLKYRQFIALSYAGSGICDIAAGKVKQGMQDFNLGLDLMQELGNKNYHQMYIQFSTVLEKVGMFRDSLEALHKADKLKEEIFQIDRDRSLAELRLKFEDSERIKYIKIIEQENQLKTAELKTQNLQRTVAFLIVVFFCSVAFALLYFKERERSFAINENKKKSKFLADAAHDLRQPMQAIGDLLEAAHHSIARKDQEKSNELVSLAQDASRVLRASFNSVLEISRLESGLVKAEYRAFDLISLVSDIVLAQSPSAEQRKVSIRYSLRANRPYIVNSDYHLLSRLIANLLSNAIKYSDSKKEKRSTVIIGIVSLHELIRIDIVDNGLGIAASVQKDIFKPFFQLSNKEKDLDRGLGLGLSIVDSILHILTDHRIRLTSRVGIGTRFSLYLPKGQYFEFQNLPIINAINDSDLTGLYLLYVEDDALVRTSTMALLNELGILCETAVSFEDLASKLPNLERMPDIVLTDYNLPNGFTGLNIITATREEFENNIPAIIMTGQSHEIDISEGVPDITILRKPISPDDLLIAIRSYC